jgi:hypothetical protein
MSARLLSAGLKPRFGLGENLVDGMWLASRSGTTFGHVPRVL